MHCEDMSMSTAPGSAESEEILYSDRDGAVAPTDNVGVVSSTFSVNGGPSVESLAARSFPFGTTTITKFVEDAAGNEATCDARVTVTGTNYIEKYSFNGQCKVITNGDTKERGESEGSIKTSLIV